MFLFLLVGIHSIIAQYVFASWAILTKYEVVQIMCLQSGDYSPGHFRSFFAESYTEEILYEELRNITNGIASIVILLLIAPLVFKTRA